MSLFIVLPAYNEEAAIGKLLDRIAASRSGWGIPARVIIVDDGSSDGTSEIAGKHTLAAEGALHIVRHAKNMGLAEAMATGIREFLKQSSEPDDIMVTMDADDTHDPYFIGELIEKIAAGADIAICSRFVSGGREQGVSAGRRLLSRGAKWFMDMLAPIKGVKDISSGYRAYNRRILDIADRTFGAHLVESKGGSVQAELLLRAQALGARVEETPFTLKYDLKTGPSKLNMSVTIKGYFKLRGIKRRAGRETPLMASSVSAPPDASDVLVLTCTYNERENIELLIDRIFHLAPGVSALLVDDNSPDGTGEVAEKLRSKYPKLNVIHRAGKLGLAGAIVEGLKWAARNGFTFAINMDADFSHDPVMIPEFIRRGRDSDYVIGSRYVRGGGTLNWGPHRIFLSKAGNTFARTILGLPVHDLTTGYRLVRLEHLNRLGLENIDARGYGFLIIMTYCAVSAGLRVAELPIRFLDRRYGASKMSANIIREAFFLVLRIRRGKGKV